MKYIRKIWVRLLISVLAGGMCAELAHIRVGEISEQASTTIMWMSTGIIFGLFSLIVWFEKYRHYYFPKKEKESDVLDDGFNQ